MASLVLGIAINTTVFSVIEAAILRPLPYHEPARLAVVQDTRMTGEGHFFTVGEFREFARETRTFGAVSAYRAGMAGRMALRFEAPTGAFTGVAVSANTFAVLGARAALGRTFVPEDGSGTSEPPIVVSHGFWEQHLGGRSDALGAAVRFDGTTYTVVGVMPQGFWYPTEESSFWVPFTPGSFPADERSLSIVGRLRPGATQQQAETEATILVTRFDAAARSSIVPARWTRTATLDRARQPSDRAFFFVLQGVVASILLIACSNVASLMLVRTLARRRDTAIRAALGASRWNLMKPLMEESLLIVAAATVLGLLASSGALRLLVASLPPSSNGLRDLLALGLNVRVFVFATLVAALGMVACTLTPALQIARPDLSDVLKEGSQNASTGGRTGWMRGALVVGQIAVSLVLLVGTGLLVGQVRRESAWRPGFAWDQLAQMPLRYRADGNSATALPRLLERVQAVPGATGAAAEARLTPLGGRVSDAAGSGSEASCRCVAVSQGYLRTMSIPLVRGRDFASSDARDSRIAVVDERLAARLWPGEDPLGRQLRLGSSASSAAGSVTVVGVARTTDFEPPRGEEFGPVPGGLFVLSDFDGIRGATLFVRTGEGGVDVKAIRHAASEVDPEQPVHQLQPSARVLNAALAPLRWYTAVFGTLAVLGLTLATIGLYGLMSYAVAQRRREIGIRLALGAGRGHVVRLVARTALWFVALGTLLGAIGGAAVAKVLGALLFGSAAVSPVVFVGVAVLLASVVVCAGVLPVLRATRTDPAVVLQAI